MCGILSLIQYLHVDHAQMTILFRLCNYILVGLQVHVTAAKKAEEQVSALGHDLLCTCITTGLRVEESEALKPYMYTLKHQQHDFNYVYKHVVMWA